MLVAVLSIISCDKDKDAYPIKTALCDIEGTYVGSDDNHGSYEFDIEVLEIKDADTSSPVRNVRISLNGDSATVTLTTNTIGGFWKIDASRPTLDGKKINFVIIQKPCVVGESLTVGFEGDTQAYVAER